MSESKTKFELYYDRLCKSTGSVFSIIHLDFPINITTEDLEKSKKFLPVYYEHRFTANLGGINKESNVSVYKNETNIYLYVEQINFNITYKLLFNIQEVNMKDVDLLVMTLKKQKPKK
jgi:hypothetical protein